MKIREIFLLYYLRGTKFCPTAINSAKSRCGNRIKPKQHITASTYNNDKICDRFKQKAVEEIETTIKQLNYCEIFPKKTRTKIEHPKRKYSR